MEKFQISRKQALERIKAADHMLTQTYPAIKDSRLLLSVLSNVRTGVEHSITAIMHYDRLFKKIPPFHDNFDSKLNHFRNTSAKLHKLEEFVPFMSQVNELFEKHNSSPVEFIKNSSLVICDDKYNIKAITAKDLKKFVDDSKRFFVEVEKITRINEEIFQNRY